MPIYWVAAQAAGEAEALSVQAQLNLAAGLAAAGWVIAAGIAWWYGSDQPKATVDVSYTFDPGNGWQCASHPNGDCYSENWGCFWGS